MNLHEQYVEACNYPGKLDVPAVERALATYLNALGITRKIVRIKAGWRVGDYPSLDRTIGQILRSLKPTDARDALAALAARAAMAATDARDALAARAALAATAARDARDARAARAALAARAARDATDASAASLQRFTAWCVFRGNWWLDWELSWMATTYLGAMQTKNLKAVSWSEPIFIAFCAGAWLLSWTDDTLYWVAKPVLHKVPGTRTLHNSSLAACECDLENLYHIRGVAVPAFVVVKPEWITLTHIETEQNAEVRRIMIERYGQSRYIVDSGAEIVEHAITKEQHRGLVGVKGGILYRKEVPGDETILMVAMLNSTAEPDGTRKTYFHRVHPELKPLPPTTWSREKQQEWFANQKPQKLTVLNAIASTFRKRGEDYYPCVET